MVNFLVGKVWTDEKLYLLWRIVTKFQMKIAIVILRKNFRLSWNFLCCFFLVVFWLTIFLTEYFKIFDIIQIFGISKVISIFEVFQHFELLDHFEVSKSRGLSFNITIAPMENFNIFGIFDIVSLWHYPIIIMAILKGKLENIECLRILKASKISKISKILKYSC